MLVPDNAQILIQIPKSEWDSLHQKIDKLTNQMELIIATENAKHLTPREAAKLFNVSTGTLHNWRKRADLNGLPFIQQGKVVRYRKADVLKKLNKTIG